MRRDRLLVIVIALTWVVAGVIDPHLSDAGQPAQATMFPQAVALSVLLFAWCKSHAVANFIKPPAAAPLLVGLVAPLGIPYYAFRAFGLRRGAVICLLALLVAIGCFVLYALSYMLSARVGT